MKQKLSVQGIASDRMRAIYYVGLTQSMTQAGDMMGLCQPAMTRQIQSAQDLLGFPLYERIDRKIVLTPEGQVFFELVTRHLFEIDGLIKSLRVESQESRGVLDIATFPSFVSLVFSRYLKGFYQQYPNIALNISTPHIDVTPLDADIVIRTFMPHHQDLRQLKLYDQVLGLYAHKDYLEQYGVPQKLEDLEHHKLLGLDSKQEGRNSLVNWALKVGIHNESCRRKAHLSLNNNIEAAEALLNGMGVYGLPHTHVRMLRNPDVIRVLPNLQSEPLPIYFIFNGKIVQNNKHMALYEYLRLRLAEDLKESQFVSLEE